MLNTSGLLYLSARVVSAAGNLLAVAVFSRLAGPAEYGHYVLIFAWSLIVYGFGAQWMRFAFFGVYQSERFGEYVGSLAKLLCAGMAIVAVALTALGIFGFFEPSFLIAVFLLVAGIALYEAAFEVSRTLLNVRGAAVAMILRAVLTILFGAISLWLGGGARGLAVGIAFAHVLAAVPALATFSDLHRSRGSRAAALHILSYGWPLLLSFGVNALGQSIDRLLLAHYLGTPALGPYGVVADVLRQSFTVLGEAIILSLVTVAKTQSNRGNAEGAQQTLLKAFNACLAAATFGAAFFIVFGNVVLQVVLKPEFVAPTRDLIPFFAIAFAFATMRNFYFAQVIYFTNASYLELVVSLLFLVVSSLLSIALVPGHGPLGAAVGLMTACIFACLVFMVLGRRWYRMPIDLTALGVMPSLAVIFIFAAHSAADLLPGQALPLVFDAVVFALFGGFAVRNFGLLNLPSSEADIASAPPAPEIAPPAPLVAAPVAESPVPARIPHSDFLGLPFSLLAPSQVIEAIIAQSGASYRYVVTPNAYHIVAAHDDPARLLPIYRKAWLSLCDSRIVRALAWLDRRSLPLVTGSDLIADLLAALNALGQNQDPAQPRKRILIVGPPRGIETALRAAYPELDFQVLHAPAALARAPQSRAGVVRGCIKRRWDIALLCVGCPAQELIAQELGEAGCKSGVALCVGASIDFLTGTRRRAPLWLQKLSLEWAYRLAREPARLWRRYLVESPRILRIFMATRSPRGQ